MPDKEVLLSSVKEYGTDAAGENVTIKLETEPKEQSLSLTIPYHRIWSLMDVIRSAASLAVQRQQQAPHHSPIYAAAPYVADSLDVGHYLTTGRIGLHLQTRDGIPLDIAMNRELAEMTILLLQSELAKSPDTSKKPS